MYRKKIKQAIPFILATAGLIGLSSQAHAERGDLTVMGKYGQLQADNFEAPNGTTYKPSGDTAFALSVGYEIDANWTAEAMYISGKADDNEPGFLPVDLDYKTIGLFGTYRTAIELNSPYFLGKIGFAQTDIDAVDSSGTSRFDASGLSYGAGVGYQYTEQLGFEAEYLVAAQEAAYILISARYHLKN